MGGRIYPGVLVVKHVWQWYYDHDYLGNKYKAIYFGPRLSWMKLFRKKKSDKKKIRKIRTNTK